MLKRIHHIGVVVPNLEEAYRFWRDTLGLEFTKSATIEEQGVKAALLKVGDSEIELLEPLSPDNGVGKFLGPARRRTPSSVLRDRRRRPRTGRRTFKRFTADRSDPQKGFGRDDLLPPSQGHPWSAGRVRATNGRRIMPIYEYRCESCQRSFEALVTRAEPQAECPECGSRQLAREMSVFASGVGAETAPHKPRVPPRRRVDAAAAAAVTESDAAESQSRPINNSF